MVFVVSLLSVICTIVPTLVFSFKRCLVMCGEDGSLCCGYSSFRGRRASMEDFYDMKSSKMDAKQINLFGVFDGHGGSCAAEYLKEHLFENLLKHPAFISDTKTSISESYTKTDSDFLDAETNIHREDGSTALTAILVGNHLYVANVGDSRAVILKAGKAIALSDDHKPDKSDERERIENVGGVVTFSGTWRVGGVLAMSRLLHSLRFSVNHCQDAVITPLHL
uniref:protein-serine/threonine phosphatase n=1 Tax=Aegilops tauschii subsp. strangulata TaxID=200361 RepID=A0A453PVY7_AEGTS